MSKKSKAEKKAAKAAKNVQSEKKAPKPDAPEKKAEKAAKPDVPEKKVKKEKKLEEVAAVEPAVVATAEEAPPELPAETISAQEMADAAKPENPDVTPVGERVPKQADSFVLDFPIENVKVLEGFNPRKDLGKLTSLTVGIQSATQINPLIVRPVSLQHGSPGENCMWLVCGERRLEAMKALKATTVKVTIREDLADDRDALAVAFWENDSESRSQLTPYEEALLIGRMMKEFGLRGSQVAKFLKIEPMRVSRARSVLELKPSVQEMVAKGQMSFNAAVEVARQRNPRLQEKVIAEIKSGMSGREVRELSTKVEKDALRKKPKNPTIPEPEPDVRSGTVRQLFGRPAERRRTGELKDMVRLLVSGIHDKEEKNKAIAAKNKTLPAGAEPEDLYDTVPTRSCLAGILWSMGVVEGVKVKNDDFKEVMRYLVDEHRQHLADEKTSDERAKVSAANKEKAAK